MRLEGTGQHAPCGDFNWMKQVCLLQNLSFNDIHKAISRFIGSQINIALISNHYGLIINSDINLGDFRFVNLTLPPFNLPSPERVLLDPPVDNEPRVIGIWTRQQIAAAIRT